MNAPAAEPATDRVASEQVSPEQAASASAPPRRRRLVPVPLGLVLGGGATLALALLLALAWAVAAPQGPRLALTIVERLAPGLIAVERIEGRLLDRLRLGGLRIRAGGVDLSLAEGELRWRPLEALRGTLPIERLWLRELTLRVVPKAEPDAAPLALPDIALPLAVRVEDATLDGLTLDLGGARPLAFERIALAGAARGAAVDLNRLELALREPALSARASGRLTLSGQYPLRLALDWRLTRPPALELSGQGQADGDLARLRLTQAIDGSAEARLTATLSDLLTALGWQATLELRRLDLAALWPAAPPLAPRGQVTTSGTLERADFNARVTSAAGALGAVDLELQATWRERLLDIAALSLREGRAGGATLDGTGHLDLGATPFQVALDARWNHLRWPLDGAPLAASPRGSIALHGSLDDYRFELNAQALGTDIPATELTLAGRGDAGQAQLERIELATLGGRFKGQAELGWAPEPRWDATLAWSAIDPGRQWTPWSGQLAGQLASRGRLPATGEPELQATLTELNGQLRGYPVAGQARLRLRDGELTVEQLDLASGANTLALDGRVGGALDLRFALDAPDLAALWPEARGRLKLTGTAAGAPAAPVVKAELAGADIAVAGQGLAALKGVVDADLAPAGRLRLDVDGRQLAAGGLTFANLRLTGAGTRERHRLQAQAEGAPLALRLTLDGGLDATPVYQGSLTGLELTHRDFGRWTLERAAPLRLAAATLGAGPLCLKGPEGAGGCVEFARPAADQWRATAELAALPFTLFKPLLRPEDRLDGQLGARVDLRGAAGVLTGSASLRVPRGSYGVKVPRAVELADFSGARLDVDIDAGALRGDLSLPLGAAGKLAANFSLPGWRPAAPARPDQPLQGRLRASLGDFSLVNRLVPDLQVAARLDSDLRLSGSFARPGLGGFLKLADGRVDVPVLNFAVTDILFNAEASSLEQVRLSGGLTLGDGRLTLDGAGGWRDAGWTAALNARATALGLVLGDHGIDLRLAPDLRLEAGPDGARLRGKVGIPSGKVHLKGVPGGALSPSSDVVTDTRPPAAGHSAYPFDLDLDLVLGKVGIRAFGLDGALGGDLRLLLTPEAGLVGKGQLALTGATYRFPALGESSLAIGRPLTVTQGYLVFAMTPLTDPGLLLTAQREGGDVTAGVRVVGTASNPKLSFFSDTDPDMTQAEVSNYLLTGIPPRRRGEERGMPSLSVGTYIAPKLFVEYENSMTEEADKVRLRYEVNDWMEVQTETGDAQGADLFFKFER